MDLTASPLHPDEILDGKYKVGRPLGAGAMGLVYEAHHLLLDKPVALKVLRPELAAYPEIRERFEAEARAAAAIGHPNIVAVTDMGRTSSGSVYFVMDRLRGQSLGERLERGGRMDPREAMQVVFEVLAGLEAAHALGLVHRDIKPDNIFLSQPHGAGQPVPKILDFGIAKALHEVGKRSQGTKTGTTVGTPHYMAPEQAAGVADLDARADLYSLGVVMYHLLAGRLPFDGADLMEVLTKVIRGEAISLDVLAPDVPEGLRRLVTSAMSTKREDRPATATAFKEALRLLLDGARTRPAVPVLDEAFGALATPVMMEVDGSPLRPSREVKKGSPLRRDEAEVAVPSPPLELARAPRGVPAEVTLAPKPRSMVRRMFLVLTAAALLVGAGMFLKGKEAKNPAPSGPAILVRFDVEPRNAGAQVFLDGTLLVSNPTLILSGGESHQVVARAEGFMPTEKVFLADREQTVTLRLKREAR